MYYRYVKSSIITRKSFVYQKQNYLKNGFTEIQWTCFYFMVLFHLNWWYTFTKLPKVVSVSPLCAVNNIGCVLVASCHLFFYFYYCFIHLTDMSQSIEQDIGRISNSNSLKLSGNNVWKKTQLTNQSWK